MSSCGEDRVFRPTEKIGLLRKLADLLAEEVVKSAKGLQEAFPNDMGTSLSDEFVLFSSFLNAEFAKNALKSDCTSAPLDSSTPTIFASSILHHAGATK